MFILDKFVSERVIKRETSLCMTDIEINTDSLSVGIDGKSVLVIGGAGSIGSSFIRAILRFRPISLVVVDINENALAELTRDLRCTKGLNMPSDYVTYPMDFASLTFKKMFEARKGFDIVANFSAHKHVRSEKDVYSVEALLRNNLINAKGLLEMLEEYPPEEYFCVSTDKAANPVNIMGASKRIMEDLIFSYSDVFAVKTARFANVAFSNGSLPAGFIARIQKLQPLSAPYDVKRYFVSQEEAGQICMLACVLGKNREIFFPKLSETQMETFDQIARDLLSEHGYNVLECRSDEEAIERSQELKNGSKDYPVHFSKSDTSGEKPFEEFVTEKETTDLNRLTALGIITGKKIPERKKVLEFISTLEKYLSKENVTKEKIVSLIEDYLPDFKHIETGKSLDEKM